MKILTLALLVSLTSPSVTKAETEIDQFCASFAVAAEATMKSRQAGVSLSDSLALAQGTPIDDLLRSLVMEAWDTPRYATEEYRQQAISDFRDRQHLSCLRVMG